MVPHVINVLRSLRKLYILHIARSQTDARCEQSNPNHFSETVSDTPNVIQIKYSIRFPRMRSDILFSAFEQDKNARNRRPGAAVGDFGLDYLVKKN